MKKFLSAVLAIAILGSLFTACSSNESSGSTSSSVSSSAAVSSVAEEKEVKLQFWSLFTGGDAPTMEEITTKFMAENSKITVETTVIPAADLYTKLPQAVASGNAPDVSIMHGTRIKEFVDQGALTDLGSLLPATGINWGDFNQTVLKNIEYDGKNYAAPLDTHGHMLFYNKKILKEAGLLTDDGKMKYERTPEGFQNFMKQLKEKVPADVAPFSFWTLSNGGNANFFYLWWTWYTQLGGTQVMDDDWKKVTIDEEKAAKILDYMKETWAYAVPANIQDTFKLFQSGMAGTYENGTWRVPTFTNTEGLEWGIEEGPYLFGKETVNGGNHTLVLPYQKNADEDKQKAAIKLIGFIIKNSDIWAKAGHIPALKSVAQSDTVKNMPYRSLYSDLGDHVVPLKIPSAAETIFVNKFDNFMMGKSDSKETVKSVVTELEKLIATMK